MMGHRDVPHLFYNMDKIQLTIRGYDKIARDWHGTRRHSWGEVDDIIQNELEALSGRSSCGGREEELSLLDLGCGNGRLINTLDKIQKNSSDKNLEKSISDTSINNKILNIKYIGIDPSSELIKICKDEYQNLYKEKINNIEIDFIVNDGLHIPCNDNAFDMVISMAVLHHVPPEYQDMWIQEVHRVMNKNKESKFIISVWARDDSNDSRSTVHQRKSDNEMIMGFAQHKDIRYVYLFTEDELVNIFEKNNFKIIKIKTEQRPNSNNKNIILVAQAM